MVRPRRIADRIAADGIRQLGSGHRARTAPESLTDGSGAPETSGAVSESQSAVTDAQNAVWAAMSERVFQTHVVSALRDRGYIVWVVPDMRRTTRGLPDVIAVHPTRIPRRLLMFELKTARGRVRPEQRVALSALGDVYRVDACIVRPADWPAILEGL